MQDWTMMDWKMTDRKWRTEHWRTENDERFPSVNVVSVIFRPSFSSHVLSTPWSRPSMSSPAMSNPVTSSIIIQFCNFSYPHSMCCNVTTKQLGQSENDVNNNSNYGHSSLQPLSERVNTFYCWWQSRTITANTATAPVTPFKHIYPNICPNTSNTHQISNNTAAIKTSKTVYIILTKLPFKRRWTTCKCVYFVTFVWPFLLPWPWPWSDDVDIRMWPRYSEDEHAYQQEALLLQRNRATRYVSWNIMTVFWLSYWQEALLIQRNHASTMSVEIV